MEQDSNNLEQQDDPIADKMRDTTTLEKFARQAVAEAVDRAQRLGYLPPEPQAPQ